MSAGIGKETMNWFTPNEEICESVTANTNIDVTGISAVFFTDVNGDGIDVSVKIGSFATSFPLPSGVPLGIDDNTLVIQTDVDCVMFAMGWN